MEGFGFGALLGLFVGLWIAATGQNGIDDQAVAAGVWSHDGKAYLLELVSPTQERLNP